MGQWLLFLVMLPWTLTIGWGVVLLAALAVLAHDLRLEPHGVLTAVWRPWFAKRWGYSTTLGRGIIYLPGARSADSAARTVTELHERVHVRQAEDNMLVSLLIGILVGALTGAWVLGLTIWWSGGLWQLVSYAAAALRYGTARAYRESEIERSAYAQTDSVPRGGSYDVAGAWTPPTGASG